MGGGEGGREEERKEGGREGGKKGKEMKVDRVSQFGSKYNCG